VEDELAKAEEALAAQNLLLRQLSKTVRTGLLLSEGQPLNVTQVEGLSLKANDVVELQNRLDE
jgi:hypothetical protein